MHQPMPQLSTISELSFHDVLTETSRILFPENNPVVSVCGGKNVGKSTLSRYLVNSALNKYGIFYIEPEIWIIFPKRDRYTT